jgi:hypothetical protein
MKRLIGYRVSCPRIPNGRFYKTKKEAGKEMYRQMMAGSSQSGISEVYEEC